MDGDNSKQGYLTSKKQSLQERTKTEVDGIINILNLKGSKTILDIPCGCGRHSIGLAKRGFSVVGSDINSIHLDTAKQNAVKEQVDLIFAKENMIDISYQEEFDAVINMFYSFGFFESEEENMKVLYNFFSALKKGGKFLFHTDVNIPRILQGKYKEDEIRDLISGNQLRILDRYDPYTKRIHGIWIIKRKDGIELSKQYSVRVYAKDEFISLCRNVGFRRFEIYGDWNKCSYDEDSEDMIVVAQK